MCTQKLDINSQLSLASGVKQKVYEYNNQKSNENKKIEKRPSVIIN